VYVTKNFQHRHVLVRHETSYNSFTAFQRSSIM